MIVIIGIIVSGIVGGQALLKQAKLRSIVSDANQLKVAMNTFKMKYDALPGDIANINSYYPSIANGNGDSKMNIQSPESSGFWEVLNVENLYTKFKNGPGVEFMTTNAITPYGNGALYRISTLQVYNGKGKNWYLEIGDISQFGRLRQVVKTQETISIDQKFDDGLADNGLIRAGKNYDTLPMDGCVMGNTYFGWLTSATYNSADTIEKCFILFIYSNRQFGKLIRFLLLK